MASINPRPRALRRSWDGFWRSSVLFLLSLFFFIGLATNNAYALCETQVVANATPAITYSAASQTITISARVTRTGVIIPSPPAVPSCPAGQNVNVGSVTFSSPAFLADVSSSSGTLGVHTVTVTITAGRSAVPTKSMFATVAHHRTNRRIRRWKLELHLRSISAPRLLSSVQRPPTLRLSISP